MKKINLLTIIFFLIGSFAASGSGINISLKEYLKKRNIDDPATQIYLLNRCSAVYTYASAVILKKDPGNSKKFIDIANSLLFKSVELRIINAEEKLEDARKKSEIQRENLFKNYTEDGKKNWNKNKSYLKGSYISEDVSICEKLVKDK